MFADFVRLIIGLVWPGVVGFAIWLFRDPIKVFIESFSTRSLKVGPQGVEFAGAPQQPPAPSPEQQDRGLEPASSAMPIAQSGGKPENVAQYFALPYQELIAENQTKIDATVSKSVDGSEQSRETVFRRMCIEYDTALFLERASRYLFGSQIDALRFLDQNGGTANREKLRIFYDVAAPSAPAFYALYPFEQWVLFLITWNIISSDNENVSLTAGGKAIVPYMHVMGYLNTRPVG